MRVSVLLLPLLLVISPGDGHPCKVASPAPEEAWNPLRPWQDLHGETRDTIRPRAGTLGTLPTLMTFMDGRPLDSLAAERPTCRMPVLATPGDAKSPSPVGPVRDSDQAGKAFAMPMVPSGCWNPLFSMMPRVQGDSGD